MNSANPYSIHPKHLQNANARRRDNPVSPDSAPSNATGSPSEASRFTTTPRDFVNPVDYQHPYDSMGRFAKELALRYDANRTRHSYYRQLRLIHEHFHIDPALISESQLRDYFLFVKLKKHWRPKSIMYEELRRYWAFHRHPLLIFPNVQRELHKLVDAPYFLVTFTLPAQLRSCFFGPFAKEAYDLFFAGVSGALSEKLANAKGLRASISGFTAVLHTWNQQLGFHPHIHCLVPGASLNDRGRFVRVKSPSSWSMFGC